MMRHQQMIVVNTRFIRTIRIENVELITAVYFKHTLTGNADKVISLA